VALLYKYLDPNGVRALQGMALFASDPTSFNDPFEVRPWFDQERHDHFARTHEQFHAQFGVQHSLLGSRSMVGISTELAASFSEQVNKRFRDGLSRRCRVLCLSRDPANVLMWGHYTSSYRGFVIGIDPAAEGFATGINPNGFDITYSADRSLNKLPLAYYQGTSVEHYDIWGNIVNHPDEPVQSDAGLIIPFSEYRRQVEQVERAALTTKARDWEYEKEVRFIYELPEHAGQLRIEGERCFVPVPPAALREIILGFRAPASLAEEVVRLLGTGTIGSPQLFFSECHPNRYEVARHEAKPQYLLDYYRVVRPSL
jgi:hypothetical protein